MQLEKSREFERYVNFEFYKHGHRLPRVDMMFERYVNFEFYKPKLRKMGEAFEFERYVNFEFYKPLKSTKCTGMSLRDM